MSFSQNQSLRRGCILVFVLLLNGRVLCESRLYFGPDRRRRQADWKGPERRKAVKEAETQAAEDQLEDGGLSQSEVEALLGD